MDEKRLFATTAAEAPTITLEGLKRKVAELKATNHYRLLSSGVLDGVRVMPDHTGMMCGDNEYVVFVGRKLWGQLQAMATIEDKQKKNE